MAVQPNAAADKPTIATSGHPARPEKETDVTDSNWQIIGNNDLAAYLAAATENVSIDRAITVTTDANEHPDGAIATGEGLLHPDAGQIIPDLLAFEAVDELSVGVASGAVGMIYGCFGAYRLPRGSSPSEVEREALLPLLAVVLEILDTDVTDVWCRRASLLDEADAWFLSLHFGPIVVTLEAMATVEDDAEELVIEVTGSDQTLRAEPFLEPQDDAGERLLRRIATLDSAPVRSPVSRLHRTWAAIQESAVTGEPMKLE